VAMSKEIMQLTEAKVAEFAGRIYSAPPSW
jgi:hypothetical protein